MFSQGARGVQTFIPEVEACHRLAHFVSTFLIHRELSVCDLRFTKAANQAPSLHPRTQDPSTVNPQSVSMSVGQERVPKRLSLV